MACPDIDVDTLTTSPLASTLSLTHGFWAGIHPYAMALVRTPPSLNQLPAPIAVAVVVACSRFRSQCEVGRVSGLWGFRVVRVLGMMEKDEEDRGREGKSQGVRHGVWEPRKKSHFCVIFIFLFPFILLVT